MEAADALRTRTLNARLGEHALTIHDGTDKFKWPKSQPFGRQTTATGRAVCACRERALAPALALRNFADTSILQVHYSPWRHCTFRMWTSLLRTKLKLHFRKSQRWISFDTGDLLSALPEWKVTLPWLIYASPKQQTKSNMLPCESSQGLQNAGTLTSLVHDFTLESGLGNYHRVLCNV